MKVVDTCGWLEYFNEGPNATDYAAVLEKTERLLVPSICIQEAFRYYLSRDEEEEKALSVASRMRLCRVVGHDADLAVTAAMLSDLHKLSLADSIVYATAVVHRAELLTQDSAFESLPGVRFIKKQKK